MLPAFCRQFPTWLCYHSFFPKIKEEIRFLSEKFLLLMRAGAQVFCQFFRRRVALAWILLQTLPNNPLQLE
jgi:hypothetical protein